MQKKMEAHQWLQKNGGGPCQLLGDGKTVIQKTNQQEKKGRGKRERGKKQRQDSKTVKAGTKVRKNENHKNQQDS